MPWMKILIDEWSNVKTAIIVRSYFAVIHDSDFLGVLFATSMPLWWQRTSRNLSYHTSGTNLYFHLSTPPYNAEPLANPLENAPIEKSVEVRLSVTLAHRTKL